MKRTILALVLCSSLLAVLSMWLFGPAAAKEDPIVTLLNLPAPPPPNPLVRTPEGSRPAEFYDKNSPPADDAPIEDLIDYWTRMSSAYQELGYNPKPSGRVLDRLLREIEKDPDKIGNYINLLDDDGHSAKLASDIYRRLSAQGTEDQRELKKTLKRWLTFHTNEFSTDLERAASRVGDVGEYVSNQDDLLALTRVDWEKAEPIVERLYADPSQKVSQVLATWALYRHAMESGGVGDVDKYRDELKAVVENKSATGGMRDLALDALVKEKEWSGRDEWYYSLLGDETLQDLRVDGRSYTGLTTIFYYTPDDKLVDKMLEFTGSDNIWVRTSAVKNLVLRLGRIADTPKTRSLRLEIVKGLLPWLTNRKWVNADSSGRLEVARALQTVKLPESVPSLISAIDERETFTSYLGPAANAAASAANAANAVSNSASNTSKGLPAENAVITTSQDKEYFPLRSIAIQALGNQGDSRAAPAIRRVLPQLEEYERYFAVKAIYDCNGFATDEQVDAIEYLIKNAGDIGADAASNTNMVTGSLTEERAKRTVRTAISGKLTSEYDLERDQNESEDDLDNYQVPIQENPANTAGAPTDAYAGDERYETKPKDFDADELRFLLGSQLISIENVSEDLVKTMVGRIGSYEKREPVLAENLRKVMLGWNGEAINSLLLHDLSVGRLDAEEIVKLLSIRKGLRESHMPEVTALRTANPAAAGISACLLEDKRDLDEVMNGGSNEAKTALLACSRLIRAPLSLRAAAEALKSSNRLLAVAAERYIESEDSPEAHSILLSRYPNQAKILGATTVFSDSEMTTAPGKFVVDLFATVNSYFSASEYAYATFLYDSDLRTAEKRLQKEVMSEPELLGIYAYDKNFVRIFRDKAVYSFEEDQARYRERQLDDQEFEDLKAYIAHFDVERLPPFLACTGSCEAKELLTLGKAGGRRVFLKADDPAPAFFAGLDQIFEAMRARPGKIRYWAGDTIPGLEVLFENSDLEARSVWKNGSDLRVLINTPSRENAVERELGDLSDSIEESSDEATREEGYKKLAKAREVRRFESFGWFGIVDGKLSQAVSQPPQAGYIPEVDGVKPEQIFGQWKARTGGIEIRANDTGLYKIVNRRAVRIRTGNYDSPVISADGKWTVVTKYDDEVGVGLVRVNLLTNREFRIAVDDLGLSKSLCYVASINRFLATVGYEDDDAEGDYVEGYSAAANDTGLGYYWIEPATGKVSSAAGEVRPLAQQTFRPLQSSSSPTDYWAAIPRGKAGTIVGIYNTKNFGFKPVLKIPKIIFDSTEMWVDQSEGRVYFTYQGQLLSAPLAETTPKANGKQGN